MENNIIALIQEEINNEKENFKVLDSVNELDKLYNESFKDVKIGILKDMIDADCGNLDDKDTVKLVYGYNANIKSLISIRNQIDGHAKDTTGTIVERAKINATIDANSFLLSIFSRQLSKIARNSVK